LQSSPDAREYCSESNRGEPLLGTADTVDVWLCLEYRPVWKAKAVTDNALSSRIRAWLEGTMSALAGKGLKARPQLIRQPEVDRDDTRLLVCASGRAFEFGGVGYEFLLGLDLAELITSDSLGELGRELREPRYLVCTNGQRDLCCARFGLPTYHALKERVGDRAWQVTHLGGHRFAPNVLVLPSACLYGRVDAEQVDAFLASTEAGRIDFARLRGRTCYAPIIQAAEACLGRQNLRLLHVAGDDNAATVTFADGHEKLKVRVSHAEKPCNVIKSCGDEEPAEIFPFVCA
jgi:hypothetical protein